MFRVLVAIVGSLAVTFGVLIITAYMTTGG